MRFLVPILAVIVFAASLGWLSSRNGVWTGATRPPAAADRNAPAGVNAGRAAMVPEGGILGTASPTAKGGDVIGGARTASLSETSPASSGSTDRSPGSEPTAEALQAGGAPRVDVIRVEPSGDAVVAGRAPAGAIVALLVDGQPVATVTADANGQFVLLPPPIGAGSHDLELVATPTAARSGEAVPVRSPETVTVVVADNRRDAPLVTLAASGKPTVVVSSPDGAVAPSASTARGDREPAVGATTRVETVEREAAGARLHVSGRAPANATVRLYLDDRLAGSAMADPQGRVAFSLAVPPSSSVRVRLDAVEPGSGAVRSRSEVSFAPEPATDVTSARVAGSQAGSASNKPEPNEASPTTTAGVAPPSRPGGTRPDAPRRPRAAGAGMGRAALAARRPVEFRVLPGQSLWQISQRIYGEGLRYTVIYGANSGQITNPDVIYPGQVFRMPAGRVSGSLR